MTERRSPRALDQATAEALARRFRALGDPTRVSLVARIAELGEARVRDLVRGQELGQPTVSHHLRLLREAGILDVHVEGGHSLYRVAPGALGEMAAILSPAQPPLSPLVTLAPAGPRRPRG